MKEYCPYKICLLGSHTDMMGGLTLTKSLNKGITLYYKKSTAWNIKSRQYRGKITKNTIKDNSWKDLIICTIDFLNTFYNLKYSIKGIISGHFNNGGLGSSSAVTICLIKAYFKVNDIYFTDNDVYDIACRIAKLNNNCVGRMDETTEIFSKGNLIASDFSLTLDNVKVLNKDKEYKILLCITSERYLLKSNYPNRVNEYFNIRRQMIEKYGDIKARDYYKYSIKFLIEPHAVQLVNYLKNEYTRTKKAVDSQLNNIIQIINNSYEESLPLFQNLNKVDKIIKIRNELFKLYKNKIALRSLGSFCENYLLIMPKNTNTRRIKSIVKKYYKKVRFYKELL